MSAKSPLNVPSRADNSTTFAVDGVIPAQRPVWNETLAHSLARRFRRNILVLPASDIRVTNSAIDSLYPASTVDSMSQPTSTRILEATGTRCHPLMDAVQTSFSKHYPLTLSPDSIWLVIAQGFSHHIVENAGALRTRMVRHEGRRELTERVNELTLAGFENAIAGFSSQIREASDPVLYENLLCDFTTTTPAVRTASQVVLMDCYSSYFEYWMECVCGIPRITVTGTPADWERIRARVEVLATYDLGWWVARLRPILDEFIQSVMGHPNRDFWQAIYKPKNAYATTAVTGWIADLFPYLNDAPNRCRNHIFDHERDNWAIPVDKGVETRNRVFDPEANKGVATSSFPSGLSSVPLILSLPDGSIRKLDLVAGYLAVEAGPG